MPDEAQAAAETTDGWLAATPAGLHVLRRSAGADEVLARMNANDVPCMPVVSLDDVTSHPQVVAAGARDAGRGIWEGRHRR